MVACGSEVSGVHCVNGSPWFQSFLHSTDWFRKEKKWKLLTVDSCRDEGCCIQHSGLDFRSHAWLTCLFFRFLPYVRFSTKDAEVTTHAQSYSGARKHVDLISQPIPVVLRGQVVSVFMRIVFPAVHLQRGLRYASTIMSRQRVFFDITIGGKAAGRVVMEVSLCSHSVVHVSHCPPPLPLRSWIWSCEGTSCLGQQVRLLATARGFETAFISCHPFTPKFSSSQFITQLFWVCT